MALSPVLTRRRQASTTSVVDAALVFIGMRLVSAVVILLAQRHQPRLVGLSSTPYLGMTMHWDALWYRSIALFGYPHVLPHTLTGNVAQNRWAFLPAFPFAARAVSEMTSTDFAAAASLLNLVAGAVAACAIAAMLETRIPRTATLGVVAVWAALPMAPTFQLAYSEALAMALLSLALLWLMREQWGRASVAALVLGLTRPIAAPLAVVFAVAAWRRWRRRATEPLTPPEWWRMIASSALFAGGVVVWPLVAWWSTGVAGAYPLSEAAWHRVGGVTPFAGMVPLEGLEVNEHYKWIRITVVAAIAVAVLLTVLAVRSPRLDPLLVTWCGAYLLYDLAVATMHADELRMLLPLFPLAAVACGVASARLAKRWRWRVWLGVTLGIAAQYIWVMEFVRYLPSMHRAP